MKWLLLLTLFACAHDPSAYLLYKYQNVVKNNPVTNVMSTCQTIDLRSHPMAWYFRTNIRENNPDQSKPNFNGQYFLLISPLSGGANWFVADCKTGKVKGTDLVGELLFNVNSSVLVRNPPAKKTTQADYQDEMPAFGYPEIYKWNGAEMLLQKNQIQPANL